LNLRIVRNKTLRSFSKISNQNHYNQEVRMFPHRGFFILGWPADIADVADFITIIKHCNNLIESDTELIQLSLVK
jgi:hypothetical protein